MPRRKKIPDRPRFDFVTRTAYLFLDACGFSRFPISPYEALERLEDRVSVYSYKNYEGKFGTRALHRLCKLGVEGISYSPRGNREYVLLYDDQVHNQARLSWTLMHEIGHILLGHLTDYEETALQRGLSDGQYRILEIEANFFAAECLMPTCILKDLKLSVEEMMLLFQVSREAARKKYQRLTESGAYPTKEGEMVIRNFYRFLQTEVEETLYRNLHPIGWEPWKEKGEVVLQKCPHCFSYSRNPKAAFCPYCGEELEDKGYYPSVKARQEAMNAFVQSEGKSHTPYPYVVRENEEMKFTVCPVCLYADFSSKVKYCPICGTSCTNTAPQMEHRFLEETGEKTGANGWYPQFEYRLEQLRNYAGALRQEDWVDYPYWEYVKHKMRNQPKVEKDVLASLLYTHVFTDDNDDLFLLTDTQKAAEILCAHQEMLLFFLKRTDGIQQRKLEVLFPDDL